MRHAPVMVDEVLRFLLHARTRVVLDGTVGYGGHAEAILRAHDGVRLIGIDRDPDALEAAAARLSAYADRAQLVLGVYSDLSRALSGIGSVDAVLLDLGISSPQIDTVSRGFAHATNGPLDMRMSREGETAAGWLMRSSADEIAAALRAHGEVRRAGRVARAIRARVDRGEMKTTGDLRDAVVSAYGRGAAPAELSRAFQAVRIAVNGELEHLERFLERVESFLKPGGRLVILSYHSLEDRMVKTFMRDASAGCVCPPTVPVCVCGHTPRMRVLTRRAVRASEAEIASNQRARSAVLRAAEKLEREGS